jgi:hypothetical protein
MGGPENQIFKAAAGKNIDDERTGFNKTMVAAVVVCLCVCWIFFAWPRATSFISFRSFHFFFVQQLSFRKTQEKGVRPSQNRLLPKTSYHVAAGSL